MQALGEGIHRLLPSRSNVWPVFVDDNASEVGPTTTFKQSRRALYTNARERAQKVDKQTRSSDFEVLLVDHQARIVDGSISTVYVYQQQQWVTSPTGVGDGRWGGLKGASRQWALDHGLVVEGTVIARSLAVGERVWLSNGVRGFFLGEIVYNSYAR